MSDLWPKRETSPKLAHLVRQIQSPVSRNHTGQRGYLRPFSKPGYQHRIHDDLHYAGPGGRILNALVPLRIQLLSEELCKFL